MTYPLVPLKRVGGVHLGKMLQPAPASAGDLPAPYMRAAHVQAEGRIATPETKQMFFSAAELKQHELLRGDVVVVEGGVGGYGHAAYLHADMPGWGFQNSILRVRVDPALADGRYVAYALQDARRRGLIRVACNAATIPHFTSEKLKSFPIPLPDVGTQGRLADYLDVELAKVDDLQAKQRDLITLLTERRAALVTRAVTVGVDENTLIETGSQWFPTMPASWQVRPLKSAWSVTDCKHLTAEFVDAGIPVASIREVGGRYVDLTTAKRTTVEDAAALSDGGRAPRPGDLIFSRNVTVGRVSEVQGGEPFCLGQDVCLLRARGAMTSAFTYYQLTSPAVQQQIDVGLVGATFRRINVGQVRNLALAIPPLEEQKRITNFLDGRLGKIDALIGKTAQFIELAKERRAALIAAAVTGQIDVRGAA